MKKCIVIPDSFKGTMSAVEVCGIIKTEILDVYPQCEVIAIPAADGGEGTVECFLQALKGEKIKIQAKGPFMEEMESFYGMIGKTAIIEMAAAAGLPLAFGRLNPGKASTYGVGQLILDAIQRGCQQIILGLGGSCTNDGGAGMAAALGTKFYNQQGETFIPLGDTLSEVQRIDVAPTKALLKNINITAMCDIDNPMYGENGAAYIFAPQKGADEKQVYHLEQQLQCFAQTIFQSIGIDVSRLKGAGAAGAMGAGVVAFLGGTLKPGIETVLDLVGFDQLAEGCDYIFTGEGKLDHQSLSGKAVVGIAARAKKKGIPVTAIVGTWEDQSNEIYELGITKVYKTNQGRKDFEEIRLHCKEDLAITVKNVLSAL